MEGFQLRCSLLRERELSLDLLLGEFHQVFVDDVTDVLEIDGERHNLHGAMSLAIVEAVPRQFRNVELYRIIQFINDVIPSLDLER